jgi:hypothetical protein
MLILKDLRNLPNFMINIHFIEGSHGHLARGSSNTTIGSNFEVFQDDLRFLYSPDSQSLKKNLRLRFRQGARSLANILKQEGLYF